MSARLQCMSKENILPQLCPRAMSELSKSHPELAASMQTPCETSRAQQASQDDLTEQAAEQAAMGNAMQFKQVPTNATNTYDKCGRPMPITESLGLKAKQAMDKARALSETSQVGKRATFLQNCD